MKKYIFILLVSLLPSSLRAGGLATEMLSMCRNIAGGLHEEYLSKGKQPPSSLNEIELLKEIITRSPHAGVMINEMTVVPGTPVISPGPGIDHLRSGWRLYAIGRTINDDYALAGTDDRDESIGRYSIWITDDNNHAAATWIPEIEVQAVLKQIGGYDPSSQPLTFPDAVRTASETNQRQREFKKQVRDEFFEDAKRAKKDRPAFFNPAIVGTGRISWIYFGVPTLVILTWLAVTVTNRRRVADGRRKTIDQ